MATNGNDTAGAYPRVMEIDGALWWVCPVRGPNCCRVRNDFGGQWAADTIAVHVQVSHGPLMEQAALLRTVFGGTRNVGENDSNGGH